MNDTKLSTIYSWRSLAILILLVLGCSLVSNLITLGLWAVTDVPFPNFDDEGILNSTQRFWLRVGVMVNHLGMFLVPGIIWSTRYLNTDKDRLLGLQPSRSDHLAIWIITIFCSYPFIAWITQFNMNIPLPQWMQSSNDSTLALMQQLLVMRSPHELLFNLLIVGLVAAIGEELIFRAIIQKILVDRFGNPHWGIFIGALVFGIFHLQFERALPLAFLGLLLGYAYYYSSSLWLVIILHFLNNSIQVILLYFTGDNEIPDIEQVPAVPLFLALISIGITLAVLFWFRRNKKISDESRP